MIMKNRLVLFFVCMMLATVYAGQPVYGQTKEIESNKETGGGYKLP